LSFEGIGEEERHCGKFYEAPADLSDLKAEQTYLLRHFSKRRCNRPDLKA